MGNSAPNGGASKGAEFVDTGINYADVKADIKKILDSPDHDDGSFAPTCIRLGWHSSGTYNAKDGTGGSNGATMRHPKEGSDPENAGLQVPRKLLESVKAKYPSISYADLWVLAAYTAIEHTGGPSIEFRGGRVDAPESKAVENGRLPNPEMGLDHDGMEVDSEGRIKGWEKTCARIRQLFGERMGFSDREIVALLCGGHVYGRCHNQHSGYVGAWVENPTRFSNEYAADLVGDKWMLVKHDTKMPDGGVVPEEVRPEPGKRQYIDLTKYEGEADEAKETRKAPDCKEFPPGKYVCVSDWVNVREQPSTESAIIGRFTKDLVVNLVAVKVFGTAIRGQAERGGWVSIIASGGKTLFERQGDVDLQAMQGSFRTLASVPLFDNAAAKGAGSGKAPSGNFEVSQVVAGDDEGEQGALFGKTGNKWALLYSPKRGLLAEKIVFGYNEKPRKALKGQLGHQMMLITDMCLLWDPDFNKVLNEYAEDEELLSKDFGLAYKRLTELGCPWSADKLPAGGAGGCPMFGCAM